MEMRQPPEEQVPGEVGWGGSSTIHHEMECHFLHFIRRQLLKRSEEKRRYSLRGGKRKGTILGFREEMEGTFGGGEAETQGATVSEFKCEHNR